MVFAYLIFSILNVLLCFSGLLFHHLLKLCSQQISENLGKMYSEMIFVHGFVHCDPHPGNVLIRKCPSSKKTQIVLLDHGLYQVGMHDENTICSNSAVHFSWCCLRPLVNKWGNKKSNHGIHFYKLILLCLQQDDSFLINNSLNAECSMLGLN